MRTSGDGREHSRICALARGVEPPSHGTATSIESLTARVNESLSNKCDARRRTGSGSTIAGKLVSQFSAGAVQARCFVPGNQPLKPFRILIRSGIGSGRRYRCAGRADNQTRRPMLMSSSRHPRRSLIFGKSSPKWMRSFALPRKSLSLRRVYCAAHCLSTSPFYFRIRPQRT